MLTRFTREQGEFAEAVREFCRRECGTREQLDSLTDNGREAHSPRLYSTLADLGYLGVSIPEEYGGSGGGTIEQVLLFEELWYGLAPVHGAGGSHTVGGILKRSASEEQRKKALGAIAAGSVMSISISEPEAGSDAAGIACKAEKVSGGYRLNGQKTWCSDAQFANNVLVVARTERSEQRHRGLTMFLVPTSSPGFEIRPIDTMGGREVNDLFFTDVIVPEDDVVGDPGRAWHQIMAGLNGERLVCAAQGVGMARRTFDDLLAYVKQRNQFGSAIGGFQAIRHRIADLAIEIEAARALTYDTAVRIAAAVEADQELVRATSMAKVKVTEVAKQVSLEGVQLMGGYGYATEYGMEAHLRRAVPATIYAGSNEIQREIISSTYGLR
ncbi:acyl-CoA dehydrogenase family protein [Sciscionella marina]|uniref:acyl-CoA dehydrogenase family protein n=1 Tax=Sciscionella marina TaxID=508770 RepID=UPI000375D261|nr:acyl-CoA dehydrogenase family protein [Sciscionella marina]